MVELEDQEVLSEEQQPQAKADYDEQRQKSRLQRMLDQKKQAAKQIATTLVKKEIKTAVWEAILWTFGILFGNPYAWVFWAAIALIVLGYSCLKDVIGCSQFVGLDGLIQAIDLAT